MANFQIFWQGPPILFNFPRNVWRHIFDIFKLSSLCSNLFNIRISSVDGVNVILTIFPDFLFFELLQIFLKDAFVNNLELSSLRSHLYEMILFYIIFKPSALKKQFNLRFITLEAKVFEKSFR